MDEIRQNRLWQMRRLVKLAGGVNAAAEKLGRSPAYVTAIAGPNPQRNIGDKMAAVIEEAFGLQPGDLDQPPPEQISNKDPLIDQIVGILSGTSDEDKEFVLSITDWVVRRSLNKGGSAGKMPLNQFDDEMPNNSSTRPKKGAHMAKPNVKSIPGNLSKR